MTAPAKRSAGALTGWHDIPSDVVAVGFVSLFMDLSSEMVASLLPIFLVSVIGASTATFGLIEGVADGSTAMTKLVSGVLSDWWGKRKPPLLAGYGLALLVRPIFPLANTAIVVFAARLTDRIGRGVRVQRSERSGYHRSRGDRRRTLVPYRSDRDFRPGRTSLGTERWRDPLLDPNKAATMKDRISSAIRRVNEVIEAHRRGAAAPLSPKLLENLRRDLERMLEAVERRDYTPRYPRFLIDWPKDEEFIKDFVRLAYDYGRKRTSIPH